MQSKSFENAGEWNKVVFLAVIFAGIIAVCWVLSPMKYSVFNAMIGMEWLPYVKIVSMFAMLPIVFLYSKMVDAFSRNQVFIYLVTCHAIIALIMFFCLSNSVIGLDNVVKSPMRIIGWLWYVWIESFASTTVALFWAIATDIVSPELAETGFPRILFFGQLGNVVGPFLLNAKRLGFVNSAPVLGIVSALLFFIVFLFWIFMLAVPAEQLKGYCGVDKNKDKQSTGFFDGLALLVTSRYLLCLFFVAIIYEAIITVFDFHFKMNVATSFIHEVDVNSYLSLYATITGLVSCVLLLINSMGLQRILGMRISLFALPTVMAGAIFVMMYRPQSLIISLCVMVCLKSFTYALNKPAFKQFYIPTSKNAKYKAQALIEIFGIRFSQGFGSLINTLRISLVAQYGIVDGVFQFIALSSMLFFGGIGIWFVAVIYLVRTYNDAVRENRIIC